MLRDDRVVPVYLIHWKAPDWCLSAVLSILASRDVAPIVTVVNNGGDLYLPDGVDVITTPRNLGYAGAANIALDHWQTISNSSWCVIGSHDLHVEPLTLASLIDAMIHEPTLGIAGPWLPPGPAAYDAYDWGTRIPPTVVAAAPPSRDLTPVYWASGTCLTLRRNCVEDVGGFDARLGSYAEDVDYCYRARKAGWTVAVVHNASARGLGTAHPRRESRLVTGNRIYLHWKEYGNLAGARELVRAIRVAAGASLGAIAPWRSEPERRSSAFYAGAYGSGVIRAAHLILDAIIGRVISVLRSGGG